MGQKMDGQLGGKLIKRRDRGRDAYMDNRMTSATNECRRDELEG